MPHTRSAKKQLRKSQKRRLHNRTIKKAIKTQVKKVLEISEKGTLEDLKKIAADGANNVIDASLPSGWRWDDVIIQEYSTRSTSVTAPPVKGDPAGFRAFSGRYRSRYGADPVRPATLAYDAVSLVAALVKTQGPARFAEETLTNNSGFAGIDGVFRFRPDGTNQRGLAVMRVTSSGGQVVSPAPKAFSASGT